MPTKLKYNTSCLVHTKFPYYETFFVFLAQKNKKEPLFQLLVIKLSGSASFRFFSFNSCFDINIGTQKFDGDEASLLTVQSIEMSAFQQSLRAILHQTSVIWILFVTRTYPNWNFPMGRVTVTRDVFIRKSTHVSKREVSITRGPMTATPSVLNTRPRDNITIPLSRLTAHDQKRK